MSGAANLAVRHMSSSAERLISGVWYACSHSARIRRRLQQSRAQDCAVADGSLNPRQYKVALTAPIVAWCPTR